MPTYEFECEECKKRFDLIMTVSEHEKMDVACPKCNSKKVKQTISSVRTITSKKS